MVATLSLLHCQTHCNNLLTGLFAFRLSIFFTERKVIFPKRKSDQMAMLQKALDWCSLHATLKSPYSFVIFFCLQFQSDPVPHPLKSSPQLPDTLNCALHPRCSLRSLSLCLCPVVPSAWKACVVPLPGNRGWFAKTQFR